MTGSLVPAGRTRHRRMSLQEKLTRSGQGRGRKTKSMPCHRSQGTDIPDGVSVESHPQHGGGCWSPRQCTLRHKEGEITEYSHIYIVLSHIHTALIWTNLKNVPIHLASPFTQWILTVIHGCQPTLKKVSDGL